MGWLTPEELAARWSPARLDRLAERDTPESTAAAVAEAISAAEAAAEEVLRERYGPGGLPTTPAAAPRALKDIVADLVPLRLAQASGFDHVAEDLVGAHERAMSRLREIARGRSDLGLAGAPPVDVARAELHGSRPRPGRLTRESLEGW